MNIMKELLNNLKSQLHKILKLIDNLYGHTICCIEYETYHK